MLLGGLLASGPRMVVGFAVGRFLSQGDGDDARGSSDSEARLKRWSQSKIRSSRSGGRATPFIDSLHAAMLFWRTGDLARVNEFLGARGPRKSKAFCERRAGRAGDGCAGVRKTAHAGEAPESSRERQALWPGPWGYALESADL